MLKEALEQYPGRAVVNSVNMENGRERIERVVPVAKRHGAALVALTIDEDGMAKTAEAKLAEAPRATTCIVWLGGQRLVGLTTMATVGACVSRILTTTTSSFVPPSSSVVRRRIVWTPYASVTVGVGPVAMRAPLSNHSYNVIWPSLSAEPAAVSVTVEPACEAHSAACAFFEKLLAHPEHGAPARADVR